MHICKDAHKDAHSVVHEISMNAEVNGEAVLKLHVLSVQLSQLH